MQIHKIKYPLKKYTFLLLAAGILGVNFFSVNVGFFQLSIYRALIILSPFLYILVSKETKHNLRSGRMYLYFRFLLIWAVYSLIPLLWIKDFAGWARTYLFLVCGCITSWFIGWYISEKKDWISALILIEMFAVAFGSLGAYEIFTGNYLFLPADQSAFFGERSAMDSSINMRVPISVFGNPNNFSYFFLFAVFGSLALFRVKGTRLGRLLSLAFSGFFMFLILASQSRSSFIGLLIGLGILVLVSLKRFSFKKRILFIMTGLFVLLIAFSWIFTHKEYFAGLLTIDLSHGGDQIRVNLIKNGLKFLVNSMLLGVGLGNIEYYMTGNDLYPTGHVVNIHNWWMEILVSSGIFIFLLYIFVYAKGMIRVYFLSLTKKDREIASLAAFFLCFLGGSLIASIGSSSLMIAEWFLPVMAVIMSFTNSASGALSTSKAD